MQRLALCFLILSLFSSPTYLQIATETTYSATLSSSQVVHSTSGSETFGVSYCSLNRTKPEYLYCHVCHQIARPLNAAIYVGEIGTQGNEVYTFDVPLNSYFEEVVFLEENSFYPITSQITDFLDGKWYISISSSQGTEYEIRGQLQLNNNYYSLLASENTFPPGVGYQHRGITLMTYSASNPKRTANFDICHNVNDASATFLGRGIPGLPGEYIYDFKSTNNLVFQELEYTITEQTELFEGFQFIQVNSHTNPQGAVRGQLIKLNSVSQVSLTSRIDSSQIGTDSLARGCGLFYYDCESSTLEYLVFHSVSQPTSVQARVGAPGESGPILFALESPNSPIYGSTVLTKDGEYFLYNEQIYIQINSVNYRSGEIRGQVTTQFDFYTFLSGNQVVPPVTTSNIGCATFNLRQFNYVLDFEILHSITSNNVLSVDFNFATPGEIGEYNTVKNLQYYDQSGLSASPVIGEVIIDDDDGVNLVQGNSFIQITSEQYPYGEIRGQIMRINPCNPNTQNDYASSGQTEASFVYPPGTIIQLPLNYNEGISLSPLANYSLFVLILLSHFVFFAQHQ